MAQRELSVEDVSQPESKRHETSPSASTSHDVEHVHQTSVELTSSEAVSSVPVVVSSLQEPTSSANDVLDTADGTHQSSLAQTDSTASGVRGGQ